MNRRPLHAPVFMLVVLADTTAGQTQQFRVAKYSIGDEGAGRAGQRRARGPIVGTWFFAISH